MELYQRKPGGVFYYDLQLPDQPRVRKSTKQTIRSRAEVVAHAAWEKAQNNGGVDVLLRKAPVLEVFAVEFLRWVEASQSIGKHSKRYYGNGWRWLKDTSIAKMPMDQIENYRLETLHFPGEPENHASANCAIRTLRKMYTKAKEMKKFYGERPKFELRDESARMIQMSEEQAELIDANWEPGEESQNSRDVFRVLRSSGFRPDECFRAQWEFVDFNRAVYCNREGKTPAARREVPLTLPPFGVQVLRDRWERMGRPKNGWVFPSPKAECGHMVTIHKPFTKARDRAGLPKEMVLYSARHGVGTALAKVTTLKERMQLMGHADIKTSLRYEHPDSIQVGERLRERMEEDAKFLKRVGVKL